ncbi:hypothetical protein [Marinimicrobium alkaliphilum]|uniref:hypothetical protein n=1 Tax=Marinimicrobium alkaliphilum TaxID=2202654 RepID=UPI000DB93AB6|nr:hypothetical protein [Marinimicrobium alkaliphilum]
MRVFILVISFLLLAGCVQSPTRTTQTVDDRPGLTFNVHDRAAERYELRVDGVSYGEVGQYLEGENLLKLVDGTHVIELVSNGSVVYQQRIYLGAGVNRVITVGPHE